MIIKEKLFTFGKNKKNEYQNYIFQEFKLKSNWKISDLIKNMWYKK